MPGRRASRGAWWRELAVSALAALTLAFALRATVVEAFAVPGGSMAPTLLDGDVVVVSRLAYGLKLPFVGRTSVALASPRRGDVVVLRDPREPSRLLVRRVVGLVGDVVELREQLLYVGGVAQPRLALGEFAYRERAESTGALRLDSCRLFREMLALGHIEAPEEDGPEAQVKAWTRATAAGAMGHDVHPVPPDPCRAGRGPFRSDPRRPRLRARRQPRSLQRRARRRVGGAARRRDRAGGAGGLGMGAGRVVVRFPVGVGRADGPPSQTGRVAVQAFPDDPLRPASPALQ